MADDLFTQYGDTPPENIVLPSRRNTAVETQGAWQTITLEDGTRFEVPVRSIIQRLYDANQRLHDSIRKMQQDHREMQKQHYRLVQQMRQMQSRFDAS